MNLLLVVRSEILSTFILIFLIIYDRSCAKYREGKDYFLGFAITALGHVILALATEITVNTPSVPAFINDALHILFFAFALAFSLEYLQYSLSLVTSDNKKPILFLVPRILCTICLVIMLFSDIEYLQGNGTKYSAGTGPTLCYMLGFVFFVASDVVLIIKRKEISKSILLSLLPLSIVGLILMGIQIVVPEFLFTGADLTLMALGAFFSIENPIGRFKDKAFIDSNAGAWNRMAYEQDIKTIVKNNLEDGIPMTFVMADIDKLKTINDTYGHLEGDGVIRGAAKLLNDCLKSAYRVYRIGGDEFAALYFNKSPEVISREIKQIEEESKNYSSQLKSDISLSIGTAEHEMAESIEETINRADAEMYKVKSAHHTG